MPRLRHLAFVVLLAGCTPAVPAQRAPATPAPMPFASASAPPPVAPASASPTAAPGVAPAPRTGLLVPLYEPPSRQGWTGLAALKHGHPAVPVTAIVNPDNGPSWARDPGYDTGIAQLQGAGIMVVGYLSTDYGRRAPAKVAADVARWRKYGPNLDGLFLDEMATTVDATGYYANVVAQAHAAGFDRTIGNAGTTPAPAIAALVDVVVAYEKPGLPPSPPVGLPRERVAVLAYGVADFDAARVKDLAKGYGWLYVSEAGLTEDPWGHLSRHAEALAAALDPAPALH